ncbi:HAD family hydrolase [Pseudobacillus badius]|uniref:HAD family hydrolase n=1 Tax=Bacillus badius TaxID=1455 RepID=UPI00351B22E9
MYLARAIIFDMDGTLFQTDKILEHSLEATFGELRSKGLWTGKAPIETYRDKMGASLPEVWQALLPHHADSVRAQANDVFHERLIESILAGEGALYPHVKETFEQISQQFALYIASNGQTEYLAAIVRYYGLDRWIQRTYSIQEINSGNKSALVGKIKQNHGITEGMVVGDRLSDIQAAKDNGFISIGCRFDFAQEQELAQADFIIEDLSELVSYLRSCSSLSI